MAASVSGQEEEGTQLAAADDAATTPTRPRGEALSGGRVL